MPDTLLHLHPTLEMLAGELSHRQIACSLHRNPGSRRFRGVRLFTGMGTLREDILYVVAPGDAARFPGNAFSCACPVPVANTAGCLVCPEVRTELLLDSLSDLFFRYQTTEQDIDALVYRGGQLDALCQLGEDLLDNPLCIHDDWFIITAMSPQLPQVMPPEQIQSSDRRFVPRAIVEDFKLDPDYLETYSHRSAQLYQYSPGTPQCLYVNLWSGEVYRGRLLLVQYRRPFRPADYMLVQFIAQRAARLMQLRTPSEARTYRSMDEVVFDLLLGKKVDSADEALLLDTLHWGKSDKLTCIRLQTQTDSATLVMEHVLHSDLFRTFPNSYILFEGTRQCVIVNISRSGAMLSQIHHSLAPLCRDYCLYAGISSPVFGPGELYMAYQQAETALAQAFRLKNERWIIPFSECALEYILGSVQTPLPFVQLAAPELRLLREHDTRTGTQYFETLRTFLLLERDIPRTAEALIIHRTTLLYRLKKIRALTELNLDNPWQRLYLTLSLWILEKEDPGLR